MGGEGGVEGIGGDGKKNGWRAVVEGGGGAVRGVRWVLRRIEGWLCVAWRGVAWHGAACRRASR